MLFFIYDMCSVFSYMFIVSRVLNLFVHALCVSYMLLHGFICDEDWPLKIYRAQDFNPMNQSGALTRTTTCAASGSSHPSRAS